MSAATPLDGQDDRRASGSEERPTRGDVGLTEQEREALAAGWPDFWKVHAAVTRIVAARVAAERERADTAARDALLAAADHFEGIAATQGTFWKAHVIDNLRARAALGDTPEAVTDE